MVILHDWTYGVLSYGSFKCMKFLFVENSLFLWVERLSWHRGSKTFQLWTIALEAQTIKLLYEFNLVDYRFVYVYFKGRIPMLVFGKC